MGHECAGAHLAYCCCVRSHGRIRQLQLSRVIRGRASGEFVPTKSHLLTRILDQGFGGNSRTAVGAV
jgi:hypothetical protein